MHVHDGHPTTVHPLDWASYLHKSLVSGTGAMLLMLLVMAAHYHAVCASSSENESFGSNHRVQEDSFSAPSAPSSIFDYSNQTSLSGMFFSGGRAVLHALVVESTWCIPTPMHLHALESLSYKHHRACSAKARHQKPLQPHADDDDDDNDDLHMQGSTRKKSVQDDGMRLGSMLLGLSMNDPFTLAYGAWTYLSSNEDPDHLGVHSFDKGSDAREQVSSDFGRKDPSNVHLHRSENYEEGRLHQQSGRPTSSESNGGEEESPATSEDDWMHVCTLHAVCMAGMVFTILTPIMFGGRKLACNEAIPNLHASVWPVFNCAVLLCCLSWLTCAVLHFVGRMPQLAVCTAMHAVTVIVAAHADMATACPLPPLWRPGESAASRGSPCWGMGCTLGVILVCISQMHPSSAWTGGTFFYLHHVWASLVVVGVWLRHVLFRVVMRVVVWAVQLWIEEVQKNMGFGESRSNEVAARG